MPDSQFMSTLNHPRRLGRTAPDDAMSGACENHAVHEYKKCMEEVMNDNPHLSVGAQQQIALERCAKLKEERTAEQRGKRHTEPGDFLRGMMSKLGISKNQTEASEDQPRRERMVCTPATGSAFGPSAQAQESSDRVAEIERKSRAIRQRSVASISSECRNNLAPSLNLGDWEEGSLQDSLENIEKSNFQEKSPGRTAVEIKKQSRRASVVSELSDVEEDEEPKFPDAQTEDSTSWKDKSNPSVQKVNPFDESISNILPDEIKDYLDSFKKKRKERCPVPAQRKISAATQQESDGSCQSNNFDESNTSIMSSIMTVDSASFNGDFSAWNSLRGHRN